MDDQVTNRQPVDHEEEPKQAVMTIRMPAELHRALKDEAHRQRVSMNQLCITKLQGNT